MPQDFSGQNLRGRYFKGQDLRDANLSYTDIRGANFTSANLSGANFSYAKAGLQRRWALLWVAISCLLAALSSFISASTNGYSWWWIGKETFQQNAIIFSVVMLGLFSVFYFITIHKGLKAGLGAWLLTLLGAAALVTAGTAMALWDEAFFRWTSAIAAALVIALSVVTITAGTVAVAGNIVQELTGAAIVVGALTGGSVGALVRVLVRDGGPLLSSEPIGNWNWAWVDLVWAWTWAWVLALIGGYIGWQVLSGDKQLALIQRFAVAIGTIGGTSFRGANLTDANFTQATLKSTDFRKAILLLTCWHQAKKLDLARVGGTYLENPQMRQLVVTRVGQDRNFDRENLQGVNLQGANLVDASFIGANLNEANLQAADLSRAKLKQTQLDGADLTRACLTGAYIEDWGITTETKLDEVECQYIYMRVPTKENPDPCRKPDNYHEVFELGDFAEFIEPIVDTLDLYHNQGVDPRAIAISFKQLAKNHPEAGLEIVAMEKRGRDKFLLRAKVTEGANRSQLSAEYFLNYNQLKSLPENHVRLLLAEKDSRIQQLENMVMTTLKRPNFYAEHYHNQGDTMSDNSGININAKGNIGDISGIAGRDISGVVNLGEISGNVTNSVNQLPSSPEFDKPGIKELLTQLQESIEAEPNLSEEDKAEALEQVKALAEAGKNPQEGAGQKSAKTAMKILKGTITGLPSAAALVEACNKLLPTIASLLGLA